MNREEILALTAGSKLDEEVTLIMQRWTVYDDDRYITGGFKYRDHNESTLYRQGEWTPSESIEHAWKVLNDLRKRGIFIDIVPTADCYNVVYDFGREIVSANEAPEAICKAALLAVMDT